MKFNIKSECLRPRELRTRGDSAGTVEIDEEKYADDFVGINNRISEAEASLEIMDETFKRFGLAISFSKTETMLFGFSEEKTAKNSLFDVAGEKIKNVSTTWTPHLWTTE